MFLSLSFSLPSPLSKNKNTILKKENCYLNVYDFYNVNSVMDGIQFICFIKEKKPVDVDSSVVKVGGVGGGRWGRVSGG